MFYFSIFIRVFRDVFDVFVNFTNFFSVSFFFTFDDDIIRNEDDTFDFDENDSNIQFFSIFVQLFFAETRKRNRKNFSSDKRSRVKKAKNIDVDIAIIDDDDDNDATSELKSSNEKKNSVDSMF